GYTGYRPAQIWVADLPDLATLGVAPQPTTASPQATAKAPTASSPMPSQMATRIRRISPDDAWYGDPQWSPDGKSIVVHANRTDDRESVRFSINKNYDLWSLDVAGASPPRQLTAGPGPEVSPRWSPDGRRLACLSSPRKGPHADVFNLAIVDAAAPTPQMTVVYDHHAADQGGERGDEKKPYPQFPLADDCWLSNKQLVFTAPLGVTSGQFVATVGAGMNGASKPAAVERLPADSRPLQRAATASRLLPRMPSVLAQRRLGTTVRVEWKSSDGLAIDGLLTTPPEGVASAPYKLVVFPHGGPHSRATQGFNFTVELFAAHGYAVFQPNFRGSQGYGRKFLDSDRNDFGGGDMRDILSGIDHLVETKQVDPKRQYVYGVSYGGYMTTWLVGQTTQFRAAVAQNAVTDLTMMWSLSDLQSWTEWEFGGRPSEKPEAMRKHSPLTYVDKIKTPTLLLHSRDDRRCPLPMGRAFHQSLLKAGVPTQLVIYPDEGHGIKQPKHREDVLRRTLAWFAEHP
ncbi:MAG TPA: S9 family peptidase, partial [Pirellulaceae bacterium]|nr:S9 family peptidase [Pirellulaceae bacterium]